MLNNFKFFSLFLLVYILKWNLKFETKTFLLHAQLFFICLHHWFCCCMYKIWQQFSKVFLLSLSYIFSHPLLYLFYCIQLKYCFLLHITPHNYFVSFFCQKKLIKLPTIIAQKLEYIAIL